MLHIDGKEIHSVRISGEFWDFDRLYFAIAKITGDYAASKAMHPYPEIKKVCETLLALNYELRSAQNGDREILAQHNGISSSMFAPAGREENVIPEGWTRERHFGDSDFDLDDFETLIWDVLPEEIDLDVYEELSSEGKGMLLNNFGLDPDDVEEYVEWLEEDDRYLYKFAAKDYPGCGTVNTWISVSIPFAEAFLYALIIQLLLQKKDRLLAYYRALAEADPGMEGLHRAYCCSTVHEDYARLLLFKELVFSCLYQAIDSEDDYLTYRFYFEKNAEKITDSNIMEIRDCIDHYSALPERESDFSGICRFLEELKRILEKG